MALQPLTWVALDPCDAAFSFFQCFLLMGRERSQVRGAVLMTVEAMKCCPQTRQPKAHDSLICFKFTPGFTKPEALATACHCLFTIWIPTATTALIDDHYSSRDNYRNNNKKHIINNKKLQRNQHQQHCHQLYKQKISVEIQSLVQ